MWSRDLDQMYFFPPLPGGIWNLYKIGPVVSEKKSFETDDDGRKINGRFNGRRRPSSYKLSRSLWLRRAKK